MSIYNDALPIEQQTISCPFNKSHTVTKFRFAKHIMKCKKNNPHIDLRVCNFSIYHYFPPNEIAAHHRVCSYRADVEKMMMGNMKRKEPTQNDDNDDTNSGNKRSRTTRRRSDSSSDEWDKNMGKPSANINAISIEERKKRVEQDPNMIVHFQHGTKWARNAQRFERQRQFKEAQKRVERNRDSDRH